MTTVVMLTPQHPEGELVDPSRPLISIEDEGLTRGDGVFETMIAVNRSIRKFDAHFERLTNSARKLQLPLPAKEHLTQALKTALENAEQAHTTTLGEEHTVKIIISRGTTSNGPHSWVTVAPTPQNTLDQRTHGVKAITLPRGHDPAQDTAYPWLLAGAKTLSYAINMAVLRYVRTQGADEAIFITDDRRILEGATSSVIVAQTINGQKTLLTPEPNHGILPGTTQGMIFEQARKHGWELKYQELYPQDLLESEGVWLASSVRLIAPVTHLNGTALATSQQTTEEFLAFLAEG
ncbi:aminodeoxychorismate lyase [Rothia sp. CCM 9418]|uniref:aminodeoxychorismate lyase n=1 Tax=Rothia sp. CCM 9418 TaxID=3402661 RepID=UPI003AEC0518